MSCTVHVIPVNDIEGHFHNPSCPCDPTVKANFDEVRYVHNAFDQREQFAEDAGDGWVTLDAEGNSI